MQDPSHALYGRTFTLLERQTGLHRGSRTGGIVLVVRDGGDVIRLAAAAVAAQPEPRLTPTKLSIEAIEALVDEARRSGAWR